MYTQLSKSINDHRVIILSHFNFSNYGNRLQSYAVLYLLKSHGIEAVVAAPHFHPILATFHDIIRMIPSAYATYRTERFRNFYLFAKENTPYIRFNEKKMIKVLSSFECVVVGSDQVWSPFFLGRRHNPSDYFLNGINGNKKIALAPSFGMKSIPDYMTEAYRCGLNSFDQLSVREESGVEIIRQLTDKVPCVLMDPTIGVPYEHWKSIADYGMCPNDSYLLVFFLGSMSYELRNKVYDYAKDHGLIVLDIMDTGNPCYKSGPLQLLGLIERARFVVTDSFHVTVFSIIFNRPFVVVDRKDDHGRDMLSRLKTLLRHLGCLNMYVNSEDLSFEMPDIDWRVINNRINIEAQRINQYLLSELQRCNVV